MTVQSQSLADQARKVLSARIEVLAGSDTAQLDGAATDADRDWIAESIASEPDPEKRKQLIREVVDSGLSALQVGQELARQVLGT